VREETSQLAIELMDRIHSGLLNNS